MKPRQWWEALGAKGRHACYEQWVREHARDLYRFGLRLCGDADTAEDLVQETFYHAWRGRGSLRSREKARAWLFQILRHRYARWARLGRPPMTAAPADLDQRAETPKPGPGEALADRETLQEALDALDDRFRMPLLMVFVQGLTCRQTADQLDLPLGTVLSRIHRARRQLRRALSQETRPPAQDAPDESPLVLRPRFGLGGDR